MTSPPEPNQPVDMQALIRLIESNAKAIEAVTNQQQIDRELARLDREAYLELARQSREELQESTAAARDEMRELRQLIESNAKAIEAQGNQSAADRDLSRQSREETREDIRQLAALMREDRERSLTLEREIRMQSGEIQNLADSIQVLYSRQPPSN